jgi:hypothetical protein
VGHFCPPGSGSGSNDSIESGSNPDPQPWLWMLISFNADPDPDPAFYLNANPDRIQGAKPMKIYTDPPGQTLKSQKVEFSHEKYTQSR